MPTSRATGHATLLALCAAALASCASSAAPAPTPQSDTMAAMLSGAPDTSTTAAATVLAASLTPMDLDGLASFDWRDADAQDALLSAPFQRALVALATRAGELGLGGPRASEGLAPGDAGCLTNVDRAVGRIAGALSAATGGTDGLRCTSVRAPATIATCAAATAFVVLVATLGAASAEDSVRETTACALTQCTSMGGAVRAQAGQLRFATARSCVLPVDGGSAGCGPGRRYALVEPATPGCEGDGSGRVRDASTQLTWSAKKYYSVAGAGGPSQSATRALDYCSGRGMRLPSREEALAIAGTNSESCAFPCPWETWTSSSEGGLGWIVESTGASFLTELGRSHGVLCVR